MLAAWLPRSPLPVTPPGSRRVLRKPMAHPNSLELPVVDWEPEPGAWRVGAGGSATLARGRRQGVLAKNLAPFGPAFGSSVSFGTLSVYHGGCNAAPLALSAFLQRQCTLHPW